MPAVGSGGAENIKRAQVEMESAAMDTQNSGYNSRVVADTLERASGFASDIVNEKLSEFMRTVQRLGQIVETGSECNNRAAACIDGAHTALQKAGHPTNVSDQLSASVNRTGEAITSEYDIIQDALTKLSDLKGIFSGISGRTNQEAQRIRNEHLGMTHDAVQQYDHFKDNL